MKRIFSIFIFLTIFGFHISEAEEWSVAKADSAYNVGNYDKAVEIYDSVACREGVSAAMLFNMGNAAYKSGDDAKAILCYRRALKLDPRNKRISENLRFLNSKIEDANKAELKGKKGNVSPDPVGFFGRVGEGITMNTPVNYWATFGVMAFLLGLASVVLYLFSSNVNMKKIGFFSSLIMFLFLIVFLIFSFMSASQFESKDKAILTEFRTILKEEPSTSGRETGSPLHRGTTVEILDETKSVEDQSIWYKVKLNSQNIGWVEQKDLEII